MSSLDAVCHTVAEGTELNPRNLRDKVSRCLRSEGRGIRGDWRVAEGERTSAVVLENVVDKTRVQVCINIDGTEITVSQAGSDDTRQRIEELPLSSDLIPGEETDPNDPRIELLQR